MTIHNVKGNKFLVPVSGWWLLISVPCNSVVIAGKRRPHISSTQHLLIFTSWSRHTSHNTLLVSNLLTSVTIFYSWCVILHTLSYITNLRYKLLRTLRNSTNEEPGGLIAAKFSSQLPVCLSCLNKTNEGEQNYT